MIVGDIRQAEAQAEAQGEYGTEWDRLAQEEREGQAPPGSPGPESSHETATEPGAPGQAERSPADTEAAPGPAPVETTDDIWAGAPEALRTAYEQERTLRTKAEQEARTNGGRASRAEREAAELRAKAPPAGQAPQAGTEPQPDEIPEALRAAREEYGEVNGPLIDEIVQLRADVKRLSAAAATTEERERVQQELGLREFLAGEEKKLVEAHSDWGEVVLTPDFVSWVREGPQFIQDGIARNGNGIVNGEEAAKILDLYKQEKGLAPPERSDRRKRQLDGAMTPPNRGPGPTAAGVPDEFNAAWEAMQRKEAAEARRTQQ